MPTTENKKAISIGQSVVINPRGDRSRKQRMSGVVSEILTKNLSHPHGILVKLASGEIGRVKDDAHIVDHKPAMANTIDHYTIPKLIEIGENHKIEFKTDALWSALYSSEDIKNHRPQTPELFAYGKTASKVIIAKTLAAFLNSEGGNLIIGYKEGKSGEADKIVGIEVELVKLKDASLDGYRRMITEMVKTYFPPSIFNMFNTHFDISFEELEGKTLCRIEAHKASKGVFLKFKKTEHFFIRVDASTRELHSKDMLEYCERRF